MAEPCQHVADANVEIEPSSAGCDECLAIGSYWLHLRICMTCGNIGCCNSSPNRHAQAHWHENENHPLIRSYEPREDWWWCYPEELYFQVEGAPPAPSHP